MSSRTSRPADENKEKIPDGVIRFEVNNVDELDDDGQYSPEVEVKGVPWIANVCNSYGYLAIGLVSKTTQPTPWAIDLNADFTLIHSDSSSNIILENSGQFGNGNKYLVSEVLDWDEFIDNDKGFIKDDKITVEIRFWINSMKGVSAMEKCDATAEVAPDGIIRFEVDQVSILDWHAKHSPEVEVKGVPWKAGVSTGYDDRDLYITLEWTVNQPTPWEIDLRAEFTLINSDCTNNIIIEESSTIDKYVKDVDVMVEDWDDFEDFEQEKLFRGFVNDDKLLVEVRFWISNMKGIRNAQIIDFTDRNEPYHDLTLIIEGEKIHVNKGILAIASPVFKTMFYGDFAERNKDEIDLKDVNREEFIELLHVIYPSCKDITDASVEYLLKLADRFQITRVIERAEEFLIRLADYKMSKLEKLRIADQYRLFGLKKHCLSDFDYKSD